MTASPIMIAGFPRAIIHMDADAFFTSVEQALDPRLRGRPVVTGQERGIIACASYEAKALGIQRGITLSDARRICPELIILPNDYETYGLYSTRMFNIIRNFTPVVEEYSVDEAFADLTGMRRVFRMSYEEIAQQLQETVHRELGITVSVGLSLSKSLAKLCSKFRKPCGFTAVPGKHIHLLLERTPLKTVWGFGPNTVNLLQKHGLQTAYDFVRRSESWAGKLLHKPGRELWAELRGSCVNKVSTEPKTSYASIIKSKTFTPASDDKHYVYARLVKNVESAFIKARRHKLRPRVLAVVLRHSNFHHDGLEARLNRPTASTLEALPLIRRLFERVFIPGATYRATMVMLGNLENDHIEQGDLFEDRLRIESMKGASRAVDAINRKYGKHTVRSGATLPLQSKPPGDREAPPERRAIHFKGENQRQRLGIPRMDVKI
jgi:DNA polymerase-4/DNA polymerase V